MPGRAEDKSTAENNGTLYHLDAKKPALVQPIEAADRAQDSKFVQVEVVEVKNPKNLAATFKVEYQGKDQEKVFLGTFSLYPSDNPGKFIVATQGKLRNEGAVVLTLVIPDEFKSGDVFSLAVKRMKFLSN
ncbi:MAG TPA: hypothetical protein VNG71_06515 [Pyrinomonadaceae bacterium]|nr:hypothetical protein [Pyrinomonadaceae bacterium]